jgi:hypothetical protein
MKPYLIRKQNDAKQHVNGRPTALPDERVRAASVGGAWDLRT